MKASTIIAIGVALLYIILQTGLSMKSEDQLMEAARIAAKDAFVSDENIETNYSIDRFSFYLPATLTVTSNEPNNIILSNKDNRLFIVFYNGLEGAMSELNYNSAKNDQALLLESFQDDNKLGYISILAEVEKEYELQVGVGGVKITTLTTKQYMEEDARELMKIARSISEQLVKK